MVKSLFLLITVLFFLSCAGMPDRTLYIIPDVKTQNFSGLQFGICHAGYSRTDEEYELLDELGVTWVRIDFQWNKMEKNRGEWDFSSYDSFMDKADEEGMNVLAILDYDTDWLHEGKDKSRTISLKELPLFLEYVKVVAERYGQRVGAFKIWNEPNTRRFWTGSDEDFFELTRQSLDLLKSLTPHIPVAVGALFYNPVVGARSYLKRLINSGVLDKADAISIHPYALSPAILEERLLDVRSLVAEAGYSTPIWITEAGFPTGGTYPNRVELEDQAQTLAEALTRMSASGVEMITWYCLFDSRNSEEIVPGMSSEAFFGIVWPHKKTNPLDLAYSFGPDYPVENINWPEYDWKPGAIPFSILANELKGAAFVPEIMNFPGRNTSFLYQAMFRREDGRRILVLWSLGPDVEIDLNLQNTELVQNNLITGVQEKINGNSRIVISEKPIILLF